MKRRVIGLALFGILILSGTSYAIEGNALFTHQISRDFVLAKAYITEDHDEEKIINQDKILKPLSLSPLLSEKNKESMSLSQYVMQKDMDGYSGNIRFQEMVNKDSDNGTEILKDNHFIIKRGFVSDSLKEVAYGYTSQSPDLELSSVISGVKNGGVMDVLSAFLTTLAVHEFGHIVVADYVGATGVKATFFKKQGNTFFLGTTTVKEIDDKSKLPLYMGGGMASDLTFEHALHSYRNKPTLYNRSLIFFSAMDLLWYSAYSFYFSDGHQYFDPSSIAKETGISKDMLFSVVVAKTAMNAYRVYSGDDRIVPYFTVDNNSAFLNISVMF
jgi:hypothetical protein